MMNGKDARADTDRFHFCFTLDTEPDNLWEPFTGLRFEHFPRLFDFHRALAERGARPVYLATSEVAECPAAARVLDRILATGQAELGAHFHTWTRRWPFPVPALGAPPVQALAHQLGQPAEERMLQYTCNALEAGFGIRPLSYRGGCWSLNDASLRSLCNSGILVDSTITPGRSWRDANHPWMDGPDYRAFPRHPFRLGEHQGIAVAQDVLELPVGTSYVPPAWSPRRDGPWARLARKVTRMLGKPCGSLWLRPTSMSRVQMRACLESLRRDRVPVWVAMIHSSEIIPCQPLPTEERVTQFVQRCLQLVEDAVSLGATCSTFEEVRAALTATPLAATPSCPR